MNGNKSSPNVAPSKMDFTPCTFPWLYTYSQNETFITVALSPWVNFSFFVVEDFES